VKDDLSASLAARLWDEDVREMAGYIGRAETEGKSFDELYLCDKFVQAAKTGEVRVRFFDH
jgi:hypothetical protein